MGVVSFSFFLPLLSSAPRRKEGPKECWSERGRQGGREGGREGGRVSWGGNKSPAFRPPLSLSCAWPFRCFQLKDVWCDCGSARPGQVVLYGGEEVCVCVCVQITVLAVWFSVAMFVCVVV